MDIRLRLVPYGTSFRLQAPQADEIDALRRDPLNPGYDVLCANEIVVDVGDTCYGYKNEQRLIFDHHFDRGDKNYPSAAGAVLHHACDILKEVNGRTNKVLHFTEKPQLWIVTHVHPDFDALCAAYLVRSLFEPAPGDLAKGDGGGLLDVASLTRPELGLSRTGWNDILNERGEVISTRFNWYRPTHSALTESDPARWAMLLAAYAACVDNCKHIPAPRATRLHSVLYAAIERGRSVEPDGLKSFFDQARVAISERGLNPLFDSLFDNTSQFAPELALLANDETAYHRDIRRARRTIVTLQVRPNFSSSYEPLCEVPLFRPTSEPTARLEIDPRHIEDGLGEMQEYRRADGIFLRDPECLLFKEWVREDTEYSLCGEGFLFTAIAISGEKANSKNHTRYYFALDPERAQGAHLYDVWTILQAEECRLLHEQERKKALPKEKSDKGREVKARRGFEKRAGAFTLEFNDPWFDGRNYRSTILDTPDRGSAIPEGQAHDLSDDEVAKLVASCVEFRSFVGLVELFDFFPSEREPVISYKRIQDGPDSDLPPDSFRFARVQLDHRIDLRDRSLAQQIGYRLWAFLEPTGLFIPPTDFIEHHLIVQPDRLVVVWSRRGIIAGHQQTDGEIAAEGLKTEIEEISMVARELIAFHKKLSRQNSRLAEKGTKIDLEDIYQMSADGFELVRRTARLRLDASMPEGAIWRRFVEAARLDELAGMAHELNERIKADQLAERDKRIAKRIVWGTIWLSFLAVPSLMISCLGFTVSVMALSSKNAMEWELHWLHWLNRLHAHPFDWLCWALGVSVMISLPALTALFIVCWSLLSPHSKRSSPQRGSHVSPIRGMPGR
jgi:hypothetical protein